MENFELKVLADFFNVLGNDQMEEIKKYLPTELENIYEYSYEPQESPPLENNYKYRTKVGDKDKDEGEDCSLCKKIKMFLTGFYQAKNNTTKNIIAILESSDSNKILLSYTKCQDTLTVQNAMRILMTICNYFRQNNNNNNNNVTPERNALIRGIYNVIKHHQTSKTSTTDCNNTWFNRLLFYMGMYAGKCESLLKILNKDEDRKEFFDFLMEKYLKIKTDNDPNPKIYDAVDNMYRAAFSGGKIKIFKSKKINNYRNSKNNKNKLLKLKVKSKKNQIRKRKVKSQKNKGKK